MEKNRHDMRLKLKLKLLAAVCFGAATLLCTDGVLASDHEDAPGTELDPAADISDFYAWHTADGKLVVALTFGHAEAGATPTYDPAVLYGVHIDNNGDNLADIDIWCRFGTNEAQDMWGLRCLNIPGAEDLVTEGEVETVISGGNGVMAYGGLRDDPFFFDIQGYEDTLMNGVLSFDASRDGFAGTNVTAIVVEMDALAAVGDGPTMQLWATTGRLSEG